jgi:hypothetical protein
MAMEGEDHLNTLYFDVKQMLAAKTASAQATSTKKKKIKAK